MNASSNEQSPQIPTNNDSALMFWKKRRNVVAVLAFFGLFNAYALRTNISVALVAMTTNKSTTFNNTTISEGPEFAWDSKIRGYILSSFFYGYITTHIFGGWLSTKIGGQRLFGIGIVMTGAFSLLTPWASKTSVYILIVVRIVEGVFEGVTLPCMSAIWSKWAPPLERTKLGTIAMSGCHAGAFVSMLASAWLTEAFGWPSVFYVFGVIAIIWFIIWILFVKETPADDPRISKCELEYIQQSLGNVEEIRNIRHPWREILTSTPVWSNVISNLADCWEHFTLITELPAYLQDKFNYGLGQTGLLSALPYLAKTIMVQVSGQMADWLLKKQIFTTTQVRKIFNCGAFAGQAIFFIAACYSSSVTETMIYLVLGVSFGVCCFSGYGVNNLDIAPRHASILMGLNNTVGTLGGICSPILTGYIVTNASSEQWKVVFYVTSAILLFACVVYALFGTGEVQTWAVETELTQKSSLNSYSYKNKSYVEE